METMAKEKGDMFDTMVVDEAKIRLGEDGWKERYYQVSPSLAFNHLFTSVHVAKAWNLGKCSCIACWSPDQKAVLCLSFLPMFSLHKEEQRL